MKWGPVEIDARVLIVITVMLACVFGCRADTNGYHMRPGAPRAPVVIPCIGACP